MSYNGLTPNFIEPSIRKGATIQSRWRHWYSSIADIMIRDPNASNAQIAAQLGKHPNTIGIIVSTDLFKEYFHQRREAYRIDHDHALRARMTEVATEGLDIILDQLRTKKSQVPLQVALKVVESSLDRLGYAPQTGPQVVVDNRQIDARQQMVSLTPADLEDARAAMRRAEQGKSGSSLGVNLALPEACGVGQDVLDVETPTGSET